MKFPIILIDNGHGKNTSGKRSPDSSLLEWSWNREIAGRLQQALVASGYTSFLIVKEEEDISLKERCARVNAYCSFYGKDNVILVSVHANAAGRGEWMNARGWSAYTSKGRTKSDALATALYNAAQECFPGMKLRKDMSDGDPDQEESFYILVHTLCAAVLTENFFYDNKEDLAYIQSEEGKVAIVDCHYKGIVKYISTL